MPSASSRLILGGLTISHILKFIPRAWKRPPRRVLENPKIHDELMLDSLVKSLKYFASHGHLSDAFKIFRLLRLHAFSPVFSCDTVLHAMPSLLSSCINLDAFEPGQQLHAHCISSGLERHPVLVPKLVIFYSAFNLLGEVHVITENSDILHSLPWNVLIASYARNELYEESLAAFKQMLSKGIRPDPFTYPSVLKACGEKLDFACARMVHGSIEVNSHRCSLYVCNALISMYGRLGQIGTAQRVFDGMLERDAVSWNAIISCYASKGMWQEAFKLFDKMRVSGAEVSVITWNTVAGGCLHTGNARGALDLLSRMRNCLKILDPVATIIGLGASSHIRALPLGKEIHGHSVRSFSDGIDNVGNALITMYSRCNDLRHATVVFQRIEVKNLITWNSIISGYARMDRSEEATFLLKEMLCAHIQPNYVTLASILPLCARVANLQHGKEFHCYILRRKMFRDYLLLWNSLVDMYARSGKLVTAKGVFDLLSKRDEVTYTSLIAGYGVHGEGWSALALFQEMIRFKIKPDHVTMVAILSACSHSKLVYEGQSLFEKMQTIYGIHPRLEHFACMVDLYGRAGLLSKARDIIERMPYEPSDAMWATLLGACRIHGNTDVGEWAAEKLLEMKPGNSGYYVLIANMYAAAGCWSKLAKVRICMRDLGVRKAPGCAWVSIGDGFSPFLVRDTSNPLACEIYPLLDGLNELMKDAGYVTSQEHVSDEEILEAVG